MASIEPLQLPGIQVGSTGLAAPVEPDAALHALRETRRITTATRWLIGDLAWASIGHDPQRIPELLQNIEGWDIDDRPTLMAALVLTRTYPSEARFPDLSWTHHKEVAKREDRSEWLQKASANRWSVHQMREAIRDRNNPDRIGARYKTWRSRHKKVLIEATRYLDEHPAASVILNGDGGWRILHPQDQ